jgi:hypothetical protein
LTRVGLHLQSRTGSACQFAAGLIQHITDDAAHRIKVTVGSGDFGLADTVVEVKQMPSAGNPEALDVVFAVTEGVRVVLSDVKIRGNDYTKDKVIRREIALGPGDRMLEDRAERSKRRLEISTISPAFPIRLSLQAGARMTAAPNIAIWSTRCRRKTRVRSWSAWAQVRSIPFLCRPRSRSRTLIFSLRPGSSAAAVRRGGFTSRPVRASRHTRRA